MRWCWQWCRHCLWWVGALCTDSGKDGGKTSFLISWMRGGGVGNVGRQRGWVLCAWGEEAPSLGGEAPLPGRILSKCGQTLFSVYEVYAADALPRAANGIQGLVLHQGRDVCDHMCCADVEGWVGLSRVGRARWVCPHQGHNLYQRQPTSAPSNQLQTNKQTKAIYIAYIRTWVCSASKVNIRKLLLSCSRGLYSNLWDSTQFIIDSRSGILTLKLSHWCWEQFVCLSIGLWWLSWDSSSRDKFCRHISQHHPFPPQTKSIPLQSYLLRS